MTRASSIKEFHQFDNLTVTIPLELEYLYEIFLLRTMAIIERDVSTSVDIRGIVHMRRIENLMRYLDFGRHKGNYVIYFYLIITIPLLRPCGEVSDLGYLLR